MLNNGVFSTDKTNILREKTIVCMIFVLIFVQTYYTLEKRL